MNEELSRSALSNTYSEDKKVAAVILLSLTVLTIFSTILHHFFPSVLDVPVEEIKAKNVPLISMPAMFLLDLIPFGLAWFCFRHAWEKMGIYMATIFLGGSFVFTGLEESMWILLGRYQLQLQELVGGENVAHATFGESIKNVEGTYYFTRGFFWFLETPVLACLGWFVVAYSCVYAAEILIPQRQYKWKATLGGLLAMNLDLWLDPVQTHEKWISWVWVSPDSINIFNIPLSNFIGWFLLIFLFALVFNRLPNMVKKDGYKKATFKFYGILLGLEFCILIFFIFYGAIAFRLVKEPIFITFWGI